MDIPLDAQDAAHCNEELHHRHSEPCRRRAEDILKESESGDRGRREN